MPETVLFESESHQSLDDVAEYLQHLANSLKSDGSVTLRAGEETVTVEPPAEVEFEVKVEREGPTDGPGELSIEVELEWDEDGSGDGPLSIK